MSNRDIFHSFYPCEYAYRRGTDEDFRRFSDALFQYLERMPQGRAFPVDHYEGDKRKDVLLIVREFLSQPNRLLEYHMSDDYTQVIRPKIDPQILAWMLGTNEDKNKCKRQS